MTDSDEPLVERLRLWRTPPALWEQLRPIAQQMRSAPTEGEKTLWLHLRKQRLLGFKFRRQQAIHRFIVDFYCREARLVVEVDGPIHQYTPQQDAIRSQFLESLGLQVLRFTNEQAAESCEVVTQRIAEALLARRGLEK